LLSSQRENCHAYHTAKGARDYTILDSSSSNSLPGVVLLVTKLMNGFSSDHNIGVGLWLPGQVDDLLPGWGIHRPPAALTLKLCDGLFISAATRAMREALAMGRPKLN
jgi:hypothetical protein